MKVRGEISQTKLGREGMTIDREGMRLVGESVVGSRKGRQRGGGRGNAGVA